MMKKSTKVLMCVAIFISALSLCGPTSALAAPEKSKGQTLYVPVYSNVYSGNAAKPSSLAITVSVRNTDPGEAIRLLQVDYYDSQGHPVRNFIDKPIALNPLASVRYVVKDSEKTRGAGAKFILRWEAFTPVIPLIAEGIMISTASQLSISFVTRGVVIGE